MQKHITVNLPISEEESKRRVPNAFDKKILGEYVEDKDENEIKKYKFLISLKKLWRLTNRRDKLQLIGIFLLTIFLSIMETFGISVIMPFITLAASPQRILTNKYAHAVYEFFDFSSTTHFMVTFSVILILFYIFRAAYHVMYSYVTNTFSFRKYHNFALRLFGKSLELTYLKFTFTNKDRLRQVVTGEAQNTASFLQAVLSFLSDILTALFLYSLLLVTNWKMTLILTLILAVKVLIISKVLNKIIVDQGQKRTKYDQTFLGLLSRSFGNFKLTKLRGNQDELYQIFSETSLKRGKSSILVSTLSVTPRMLLETVGFSLLIASVAYILIRYNDASAVLPIISMYALALYRLLPIITNLLSKYQSMLYQQNSVNIVYEALHEVGEEKGYEPVEFEKDIELKDVDFSYIVDKPVLQKINLTIKKGQKVAFVGPSGAGKSTLVDLIIGVYHPKGGNVCIDGKPLTPANLDSWRRKVGYIPQQIFLYDGTVAANIAFGEVEDEDKIIEACKKANIYDFLVEHKGIKTTVGDGGVRLSGGQLQRIGIARALYNDPEILVLDEATSALDNDTEARIMEEIYKSSENKTLLVIAHRLSTIERCDTRVEVKACKSS
ncbi:ABC transporter ATP-binding protein [Helicobacter sp. 13S00401-1]|uniref:ABC transporter ATP-binding protein/permease n=1 Tax=Helicobacter sp. 13S00401-1 TaxID=1905758 RepID=UPI000BA508C9|nr:ABC transporter ATP-binding protein [Helicobacter sp. 13S00401-1]